MVGLALTASTQTKIVSLLRREGVRGGRAVMGADEVEKREEGQGWGVRRGEEGWMEGGRAGK